MLVIESSLATKHLEIPNVFPKQMKHVFPRYTEIVAASKYWNQLRPQKRLEYSIFHGLPTFDDTQLISIFWCARIVQNFGKNCLIFMGKTTGIPSLFLAFISEQFVGRVCLFSFIGIPSPHGGSWLIAVLLVQDQSLHELSKDNYAQEHFLSNHVEFKLPRLLPHSFRTPPENVYISLVSALYRPSTV